MLQNFCTGTYTDRTRSFRSQQVEPGRWRGRSAKMKFLSEGRGLGQYWNFISALPPC